MLPSITIVGGLVADPELKFSQSGNAWAAFRLAAKDRVRGDKGEWVDGDPLYIDVVCFGKYAENLAESATRGDTIMVTGQLRESHWEAEDGSKRSKHSIKADEVGLSLKFRSYKAAEVVRATAADDPWASQAPTDQPPF